MVCILPQLNCVQNAKIFDLVVAHPINKSKSLFLFIWFYTSDKMHVGVR